MSNRSDIEEMFETFKRSRATLIRVYEGMAAGPDKDAVAHYIQFGSGIDTATPDTIIEIVSKIIRDSEGDPLYMRAMQVLAGKRGH
jgi:hypothetical protein